MISDRQQQRRAMTADNQELSSENWFADLIGNGVNATEQLKSVKEFAYKSFDAIDKDKNGYLSHLELEYAINESSDYRQRAFLKFLLDNHEQIAESEDDSAHLEDGISRQDLESYFDLIVTLLC